jgi:carboxymethylenebutenolidase
MKPDQILGTFNSDQIDPALDPKLDQLSRRSFLGQAGAGAAAAAALATGACAQAGQKALEDTSLKHEDITFESGGQKVKAFLCRAAGEKKRGAVIVVHEIFGLNDHIKDVACRFAKAGYDGLAVDFFTREGAPPELKGDFAPLMAFVNKIPDRQIMGDVAAAARHLNARDVSNGKVGIVGFCWGGRVTMLSAAKVKEIDAASAYYGRITAPAKTENQPESPMDLVASMKAPLLGNFGETDTGITKDVEPFREALKKEGKTAEIYVYNGAGHAFNNDTRPSYNVDAAKLAWQRTLDWFGKYLK